ncbi:MAG: alpha/beta fold hydrolase [Gemmatimonadaceae bacterium]
MIGAALAIVGALAVGARAVYPRVLEYRASRRRPPRADGVIAGAASIARHRADAPGVLLLHGGGDTPQVVGDLAEHLYSAGFSVRAPLLPGHGRALSALMDVSAADLHANVEKEYSAMQATHDWVALIGLSMGGALAVRLAAAREVPALVLLAPYLDMPAPIRRLAAAAGLWGWALPYFPSRGDQSIRDQQAAAQTLGHGLLTPALLRALYDITRAVDEALPKVSTPTLFIQSREDNRISVESAERAFARLGSPEKRLVMTAGAGHVITVDYGRERVMELCAEWLHAHHVNPSAPGPRGSRQDP